MQIMDNRPGFQRTDVVKFGWPLDVLINKCLSVSRVLVGKFEVITYKQFFWPHVSCTSTSSGDAY